MEAKFITAPAYIAQNPSNPCEYITMHNQLFQDIDDSLYFVPRYFTTDGYTINNILAPVAGNKMQWDIRAAIQHDFECKYHKALKIKLSLDELKNSGLVHLHYKTLKCETETKIHSMITVCENIPKQLLIEKNVTFNEANSRFKRAMAATGNISNFRVNLMRTAVNFNISWLWSKKEFDIDKLYADFI